MKKKTKKKLKVGLSIFGKALKETGRAGYSTYKQIKTRKVKSVKRRKPKKQIIIIQNGKQISYYKPKRKRKKRYSRKKVSYQSLLRY